MWVDYIVVALLGGAVNLSELVSRYRDAPKRALGARSAWGYIALGALASVITLKLAYVFEWNFGSDGASSEKARWLTGLVASFGSMAVLRSSLFTVRIGEKDVGVGPAAVLQIFLDALDRSVDRDRASDRATIVVSIMRGIDFDEAHVSLPALCLDLLQNMPADAQRELAARVTSLKQLNSPNETKTLLLGLVLMNYVGEDVLRAAVAALAKKK